MRKNSFKEWLIAVRPWSFTASAMPVIVTLGYLFWSGADVNWTNGIWALLNIIVFHAAGNTWSDYFDYRTGVDAADTFGVHTLTDGQFTPREIYRLALGLLMAALAQRMASALHRLVGGSFHGSLSLAEVSCLGRCRHLHHVCHLAYAGHLLCGCGLLGMECAVDCSARRPYHGGHPAC